VEVSGMGWQGFGLRDRARVELDFER
jgi:hypothetical protein